jgi:hypothetical protein
MRILQTLPILLVLLLGGLTVCAAQPAAEFAPPGPNVALHKPYTLEPNPNYSDCTFDPDRVVLTDGIYTEGYFWVQKTTVGWVNTRRAAITFDLGQIEPIAGLSYSTAAGVAGVVWPASMRIMVSDDGKQWTDVGDLVRLSNKRGEPAPQPYALHRFVTGELQCRGRYVALVVDQAPYTVVDEIEVYRGQDAWLNTAPQGRRVEGSPLDYCRARQVIDGIQGRMRNDLDDVCASLEQTKLGEAEKAALQARVGKLRAEIETQEDVPADFKAIFPMNSVHAGIYALNAPLLRARGYKALTPWQGNRWDNLKPTEAPAQPPAQAPALLVQMISNEYRAEAFNLTNPTDAEMRLALNITGLPGGTNPAYLSPRQVLFTDSIARKAIAAALPQAVKGPRGYEITIPAGMTRQVWLSFHPTTVQTGTYRGQVKVIGPAGESVTLPLSLQVYPFTMPAQLSIAVGGWDYLDGDGAYDAAKTPQQDLIRCMEEHFVDTAQGSVRPEKAEFDDEGKLTNTPDFTAWDRWIAKWHSIRTFEVFLNMPDNFAGSKMGTPRFNRAVGEWVTSWVAHMKTQNLKPSQLKLMILDEPTKPEQDEIILAWTKAIKAAQPEVIVWEDPCHPDPYQANQEMLSSCDVLCPHRPRFISADQSYRDYFLAQQKAGRELAFYSCSAGKQADPIAYHRGQFWSAIKYNAKGSFYWAFCDEGGAGTSWNPYQATGNGYTPMFIGPEGTTDGKHMEAIREGAEDYEYFQMLKSRVTELEQRGVKSPVLAETKTFLENAPDEVLSDATTAGLGWDQPRDRGLMDRARVQALGLLVKLSKL